MSKKETDNLDALSKKIAEAKGVDPETQKPTTSKDDSRQGAQAGVELIAAVGVFTAIGYGLDQYFDTQPLWMLVCMLLGMITGFYNVYRTINNIPPAVGYGSKSLKDEDTDKKEAD